MNNIAVKTSTVCKGFGQGETRTEASRTSVCRCASGGGKPSSRKRKRPKRSTPLGSANACIIAPICCPADSNSGVCDEPTAALDSENGAKVMEILKNVAAKPDRCVIIVTHDNRIFKICRPDDPHGRRPDRPH